MIEVVEYDLEIACPRATITRLIGNLKLLNYKNGICPIQHTVVTNQVRAGILPSICNKCPYVSRCAICLAKVALTHESFHNPTLML